MSEQKYWVWLAMRCQGMSQSLSRLLQEYSSPQEIYFTDSDKLKKTEYLTASEARAICDKSLENTNKTLKFCNDNKIRIICYGDDDYPERLRDIHNPPIVLYVRGNWMNVDKEAALAIVGTRNASRYGMESARKIAAEYAGHGGVIVTGLARGIDSIAAVEAVRVGGRVIGVLGNGIDIVYPYENKQLYDDVCRNGAIVTEFPPHTKPYRQNFPLRNRIISGLSIGTLVVEAPVSSGSLITANFALESGRDVFAIPGRIDDPNYIGSNELIRDGATLVTSGTDIAIEYMDSFPERLHPEIIEVKLPEGYVFPEEEDEDDEPEEEVRSEAEEEKERRKRLSDIDLGENPELLDECEKAITSIMSEKEKHIDDIISESGLHVANVLAALTTLEIKGYVVRKPGDMYSLDVKLKY